MEKLELVVEGAYDTAPDAKQFIVFKQEWSPSLDHSYARLLSHYTGVQKQERSPSLDQEEPEVPHIKVEQEELWTSQEGEQLQALNETDITNIVYVKKESDYKGEPSPQSVSSDQREIKTEDRDDWKEPGLITLKTEERLRKEDAKKLLVCKKACSQEPELPHIKVEQEELWTSQEGEQVTNPVSTKSKSDYRETRSTQTVSTDQSESKTEDGDNGWKEPGLNTLKTKRRRKDAKQLLVCKEACSQKPELPHIKVEQEELWTSQEGEQLQGLNDTLKLKVINPVSTNSESDYRDTRSTQTVSSDQSESKTEDGDNGWKEPGLNTLKRKRRRKDQSETMTEDRDDYWKEPSSNTQKTEKRQRKGRKCTTVEILDVLVDDGGAYVFAVDTSSDDEDLLQPEWLLDSDPDYRIPSEEGEDSDNFEPPTESSSEPSGISTPRGQQPLKQPASLTPQPEPSAPTPSQQRRSTRRASAPIPQPSASSEEEAEEVQPKRKRRRPHQTSQPKGSRGGSTTSREGQEELAWRNRSDKDKRPEPIRFMPARTPGPTFDTTATWSPLALFQLFFSTSVVRSIIDNTNANARKRLQAGKKFMWKALTVSDFYIFMAIIMFTGLVDVHHRSDYWRKVWPYNFSFPGNKMTRDRFESILWSLHLSNPKEDEENDRKRNTAEYDKLFRIKPLYTDMVIACQAQFQPYRNICIDERMLASKARSSMKQYMKEKPTKWGYKLFVLADASTAYTWNFFVYTGKSVVTTGHGLSYSSVMDLLPLPMLGGGYTLYVDNFYTSPELFQDLAKRKIACCGTIRNNRICFPKKVVNDLPKKAERGDLRWLRKDGVLFVKWMDTREVTMCSTVHEAFSGQTVQRTVKEAGVWQTKTIPIPDAVVDYNKSMGGVDLSHALIGYYSVLHKTMKWYKTFFYHFMDIAVVNSFLLHKELSKLRNDPTVNKPLTQKKFREQLTKEMLEYGEGLAPPPPTPPSTTKCMPEYYGGNASAIRRSCKRCHDAGIKKVKTPVYCQKCQVPLCFTSRNNCFRLWHESQ